MGNSVSLNNGSVCIFAEGFMLLADSIDLFKSLVSKKDAEIPFSFASEEQVSPQESLSGYTF